MTDLQQDMTAVFWEGKIVLNVKFDTEECWSKYPQTVCYYSFLLKCSICCGERGEDRGSQFL
jgi:hypothetical protein